MNEIFIILFGIFIFIIFIILFILLYYLNDNYIKQNNEMKNKLYKSEQNINDNFKEVRRLQDNVINSNNNITTDPYKMSANLLNIMDVSNNGVPLSNLITNSINPSKPLQIKLKPEIITQSNLYILTNSNNYLNICDNSSNRKCLNINVDGTGTFNINTSNNVSSSNIANVSVRDISGNVMAVFDGVNKKISFGSNIAPAIEILENVYTPDIITCQYQFVNERDVSGQILFTFISNFNIKSSTFINLPIFEPYIIDIANSTTDYTMGSFDLKSFILKMKPINDIPKNTFKRWNIPVTYSDNIKNTYGLDLMAFPARTTAYITLS
jgi:hypothetical protein